MASTSFLNPLCDIVVPIWNQRERTQRCLESVLRNTDLPIRLILIDNGSEAETRNWLDRFASQNSAPVKLIRNSENLGFIKAVNQGIRAAQSPWVCLLNNDTIVTAGWLAEMIRVAEANPRIALSNPTSNSLGFQTGPTPLEEYARSLQKESGRWVELTTALGFCLLAPRTLFDQIGLLDEGYGMGNFDDDDLSRRVRQANLLCVRACGAYVFHEEKVSFRELPSWQRDFDQNRRRFQEKWGRPLRILYELVCAPAPERALGMETAALLAREGHWVYLVLPRGAAEAIPSQAQVTRVQVDPRLWRIQAAGRLCSKRKKPFDLVITEDTRWARWVKRLRFFHRAELLEKQTKEEIREKCLRKSRLSS